jgi:hypothetical protein
MSQSKYVCSTGVAVIAMSLCVLSPHIAAAQPVTCSVFDDGYALMSSPADAVYFAGPQKACIPDGSASGNCNRWFGRCATPDKTPVYFRAFDDGAANLTAPFDAVYDRAPNSVCVPGGPQGDCRRWFGMASTSDGRAVRCYLFNDGNTNRIGPTDAIYYPSPVQVCMPDGSATGACR